jgi:hypothetical protein
MATFDNLSYEANKEAERDKRDPVVEQVKDNFTKRSETGIAKYGTTLERGDLSLLDWLNHLQEELMDATLYIQKLKNELDQNPNGIVIAKESWDKADKITHEGFVYVKYTDLTGV